MRLSLAHAALVIQIWTVFYWSFFYFFDFPHTVPWLTLVAKLTFVALISGMLAWYWLPKLSQIVCTSCLLWTIGWIPSEIFAYHEAVIRASAEDREAIDLADKSLQLGNLEGTHELYSEILQKEKRNFFPEALVARTALRLVSVEVQEGQFEQAEKLCSDAFLSLGPITIFTNPFDESVRIELSQELATIYLAQKRFAEAEQNFKRTLVMHERVKSENALELECRDNYVKALRANGKEAEAQMEEKKASLLREALEKPRLHG